MTDLLFLASAAAAVLFVAVLLIEGALRPGYNPIYHTGSELELGDRGWVQRANFLLMGGGAFAFAAAVNRTLNSGLGAVLLAIFALGLIVAGVFVPDPVRGYPSGAQPETPARMTWQARVHATQAARLPFFALFGACLAVASHLQAAWAVYTVLTAVIGLAMTIWTALAFQRDAANTGLIQRGLILVYWTWIVLVSIHLMIDTPAP